MVRGEDFLYKITLSPAFVEGLPAARNFSCGQEIILMGEEKVLAGGDEALAGGDEVLAGGDEVLAGHGKTLVGQGKIPLADKIIYLAVDDHSTRSRINLSRSGICPPAGQ
jgi:hypothetical protein